MTRNCDRTLRRLLLLACCASAGCGGGDHAIAPGGAGPATRLAVHAGADQTAIVGTSVSVLPAVIATDSQGHPVPLVSVTFSVTGAGGGSLTGSQHTTGNDGVATVGNWILGTVPGGDTLQATVPGLAGSPVTFTATAVRGVATLLAAGQEDTCALTTFSQAYCWGDNSTGELGTGTSGNRWGPATVTGGLRFTQLAAGWGFSCGLDAAGHAYCWGANSVGELGDGTLINRSSPVAVVGGFTFSALAAGNYHVCGLTGGGRAYCWGYNPAGQLGDGTTTNRNSPVPVSDTLTFVELSAGGGHTCGLTAAGRAYCWGHDVYGQLGDSATTNRSTPVAVTGGLTFSLIAAGGGYGFTCGLATGGQAYCWGQIAGSPYPIAIRGSPAFTMLVAGGYHVCGLTSGGQAYCWGNNYEGQLGDGTTTAPFSSVSPVAVTGGLTFTQLALGDSHTCGLTTDSKAYCWGWNNMGQLGAGTGTDVGPSPLPVSSLSGN
jgi:alpha-tubulin suppressor-like RCC1 family protein